MKETESKKSGWYISDKINLVGIMISIIVLVLLANQTNILNTQFQEKDRPWIGVTTNFSMDDDKLHIGYTNFGSIPNTDGKILVKVDNKPFSKDHYAEWNEVDDLGVVLPNQEKFEDFYVPMEFLQQAKNGTALYFGIVLNYNYVGNQQGEFGGIWYYSSQAQKFYYDDNWAK